LKGLLRDKDPNYTIVIQSQWEAITAKIKKKGGRKGFEVPAKKQQCTKITDPSPMKVRGSVTNFVRDQSRKVKG
jgi:hypothetical protein